MIAASGPLSHLSVDSVQLHVVQRLDRVVAVLRDDALGFLQVSG